MTKWVSVAPAGTWAAYQASASAGGQYWLAQSSPEAPGVFCRYQMQPATRFVIDTSRNGQGPWTPPVGVYPDPQDWCNPPGRGLGARPTADTGVALLDAKLWVKVPGESDGSCTRGTAGPGDPEYGNTVDPAAGVWWPDQIHGLASRANPTLTFNWSAFG